MTMPEHAGTTFDMSNIETVVTYELDGKKYEVDHLGIPGVGLDSQWGMFVVFCNGQQVAEFALAESFLRKEFRPAQLPVTDAELIAFAKAACRGDLDGDA